MKLRLSEAIRFGAMLRPQAWGAPFLGGGSCAMGAAKEAVTGKRRVKFDFNEYWPWLTEAGVCPECGKREPGKGERGGYGRGMGHVVAVHLNDCHKWTRQRIADWVETVEPKEAKAATGHELHEAEVSNAAV